MYSAFDIAKYIVCYAIETEKPITNLKLQKLLYYAQAWYLVNYKKPLFNDEIEAWQFGPVIPTVYEKYKKFGRGQIECNIEDCKTIITDKQVIDYLDEFCEKFIDFSASDLVGMTHNEAPWINAFNNEDHIITHEAMLNFYSTL